MDLGCHIGQCSSGLGGGHVSEEAVSSLVLMCLTFAANRTVTESQFATKLASCVEVWETFRESEGAV